MPELPDITLYLEALERRVLNQPFSGSGSTITVPGSHRRSRRSPRLPLEKCIVCAGWENASSWAEVRLWLVLHLMIAGRLHWREVGAKLVRKLGLAAFDFENREPGLN